MEPAHSFTVHYDEASARAAVRAYVWRSLVLRNRSLWIVGAALAGLGVWLVAMGDRSWVLGLVVAGALLPPLFLALVWRAHFANTVGRFRRMRTPQATFELGREELLIRAEDATVTVRWAAIVELWETPDVWMALLAPNQFFLLPVAGVPEEALAAFRERAGGAAAPSGAP